MLMFFFFSLSLLFFYLHIRPQQLPEGRRATEKFEIEKIPMVNHVQLNFFMIFSQKMMVGNTFLICAEREVFFKTARKISS